MTDMTPQHIQPSPIRLPQQWEWTIMQEYAKTAVSSGLVGSSMTKDQAFFVILKGYELGITPMQALAEIHLIKGKPGLSVQLMIGLANRSGMLSHFDMPDASEALKAKKATVTATRRDRPESPICMTFSIEDAQSAGLLSNPTWKQYPGQMLVNRAVSMLLRRIIPEALSGMYLSEELENITDERSQPLLSDGLNLPPQKPAPAKPATQKSVQADNPAPTPPVWWAVLAEYKPFMNPDDFATMRTQLSEGVKSISLNISDNAEARVHIEKSYGLLIDLDTLRAAAKEMDEFPQ